MGVATAAGVEALPKPQERDNYRLEYYFQKIFLKNLGAKITLYPKKN
jgi:hypothetical protein